MTELLLLSGGIDSIAICAWRRPKLSITIDYGQRPAKAEISAAAQVCKDLDLRHEIVTARIPELGSGRLAGDKESQHSPHAEFWPFRNQYLITLAAMVAIEKNCKSVLIGTVSTDSRHRDGSPEFLIVLDDLLRMQEGGVRLVAPALNFTTEQLLKESSISLSTLAWAHSCHTSDLACGDCPGCNKHSRVMHAIGHSR